MTKERRLAHTLEEAAEQLRDQLDRHGITLEQWNRQWTPEALAKRGEDTQPDEM